MKRTVIVWLSASACLTGLGWVGVGLGRGEWGANRARNPS